MIELRNITLQFGRRVLVEGISTRFRRGEITALLGRNGTGKSTLLRTIANLLPAASGEVLIDGRDVRSISADG